MRKYFMYIFILKINACLGVTWSCSSNLFFLLTLNQLICKVFIYCDNPFYIILKKILCANLSHSAIKKRNGSLFLSPPCLLNSNSCHLFTLLFFFSYCFRCHAFFIIFFPIGISTCCHLHRFPAKCTI